MTRPKICSISWCPEPVKARGLCASHDLQLTQTGDPIAHRRGTVCSVENCWNNAKARGLCSKHHQRLMRHGDVHAFDREPRACKVDGCEDKQIARGWCAAHYAKWRRTGNPEWERQRYCAMSNCWTKPRGHGLCPKHYFRWRKYGDPFFDGSTYWECCIEGCYQKRETKAGYCTSHQQRLRRYGHPLGGSGQADWYGITLPIAPVDEILDARGGLAAVMDRLGPEWEIDSPNRNSMQKALDRCRTEHEGNLDLVHADEFACKVLRSHPALIWGEDYWRAIESEHVWEPEPEPTAEVTELPVRELPEAEEAMVA